MRDYMAGIYSPTVSAPTLYIQPAGMPEFANRY